MCQSPHNKVQSNYSWVMQTRRQIQSWHRYHQDMIQQQSPGVGRWEVPLQNLGLGRGPHDEIKVSVFILKENVSCSVWVWRKQRIAWNISFIRNKLPLSEICCQLKEERALWGEEDRSKEKVRRCSCTQSLTFLWLQRAPVHPGCDHFQKKNLSDHIFILPFTWQLCGNVKRWFMHEAQAGDQSQSSCRSSFNEVFHTRPAIIWIHCLCCRFLRCFAQQTNKAES